MRQASQGKETSKTKALRLLACACVVSMAAGGGASMGSGGGELLRLRGGARGLKKADFEKLDKVAEENTAVRASASEMGFAYTYSLLHQLIHRHVGYKCTVRGGKY